MIQGFQDGRPTLLYAEDESDLRALVAGFSKRLATKLCRPWMVPKL